MRYPICAPIIEGAQPHTRALAARRALRHPWPMATTDAPPLDVAALTRLLDGVHADTRARVRAAISAPEFAPVVELPRAEHRERTMELLRVLTAAGGTALGFPVAYGGAGDVGASVAAFETLAHGDLSVLVKCGVQFGLFGGAVLHLGSAHHHERYLRRIATLELPGCFAMSESGHGSDVQALRTTATYDPQTGEFVVDTPDDDARKDYIGNAAVHGRLAVVFAQLHVGGQAHGVHALLVPLRDEAGDVLPGVRIEDCGPKLGLNGVDNGRIWFHGVRVERDALLDRYAQVSQDGVYSSPIEDPDRRFFTMLGTLVQGRVSVGGAAISATKSALTIAMRHALRRRQFGPPGGGDDVLLLDYRTHQRRLLPALATTYALHVAQEETVAELHRVFAGEEEVSEHERRELESRAAGLKAIATRHATDTIQECREACGGLGYLSENRIAALKADTDVFTTFEGDNTVLLQLVAKSLLTGYRQQFSRLDPLEMVGFVAGQVLETIAERSAAREIVGRLRDDLTRRGADEGDLLRREDQLELFRWRERHVLAGVARRLKRGIDDGGDAFAVFLDCQDHVVEAARAHVDRLVLEAFAAAVARTTDERLRATLDRLCDLHALARVEAERGWYQEHGRLSSTRAKAVTRAINRLCAEVRADAGGLVDAFAIPDAVLAAPIALRG
jgi:acyl-CoA oxidase